MMGRGRTRAWAASAVAIALATLGSGPVALADDLGDDTDPAVLERMEAELERQRLMLSRLRTGEGLEDTDLEAIDSLPELELPDEANPRVAPAAPVDRPLPVAIFEERDVTIERDTWDNTRDLRLIERVLDADGDGQPELVRWVDPDTKRMVRQEEDRNYDGVVDAWSDYRQGVIRARTIDSNDDGNPDTWERYEGGRMTAREIDRDDDGVRDAFYEYRSGSIAEESHDTDNDGQIDLRVFYTDRQRTRAEEDRDKDGRMDAWRVYALADGDEIVVRIEKDEKGRGFADTFETYEILDGKAMLAKREEDVNGDGEVDILSFYRKGKLVKREILDPDLVPL